MSRKSLALKNKIKSSICMGAIEFTKKWDLISCSHKKKTRVFEKQPLSLPGLLMTQYCRPEKYYKRRK